MSRTRRWPIAEQPTASPAALVPSMNCPVSSSVAGLKNKARCPHRGAHDLDMRAAAAQIVTQRFHDLGLGWMCVARQQRLGRDDHAVKAVAALRGLFGNERLLYRIRMRARAEAFERHNVAPGAALD